MDAGGRAMWDEARVELIRRWRDVLGQIDAQDEGGVLALTNEMDEFCDAAQADRQAARMNGRHEAAPEAGGTLCLFCRGFVETGGCLGSLQELNRAVLSGRWAEARRVAEVYLQHLQAMRFPDQPESPQGP